MKFAWSAVLLGCLGLSPLALADPAPRISIIIDDLGYQLDAGQKIVQLPWPLTVAILPATPRGRSLAAAAHKNGKEVLLHLPLQAVDADNAPAPGNITLDMSRETFSRAFAEALDSVPFAVGVSSHRGSLLTRHPGHMTWLMQEIEAHGGLFFVDSYTTPASVAMQMADEAGVSATRRDVFLDHDRSPDALAREFERLKQLARQRGFAVGIGHPYPETIDFLEGALPRLVRDGFELIRISELFAR